jgi:dipeptidase
MMGEYFVKRQLNKLAETYQGKAYHNLMFGVGETSTQLDNLLITNKAVYVIEVKNYAGRIYGGQYQDQWYQTIRYDNKRRGRGGRTYTKTHIAKNAFFNPIKQNQMHVNALKSNIQSIQKLPFMNVVVFMNRGNLDHIEMKDEGAFVINRSKLCKLIKQYELRLPSVTVDMTAIETEILAKNTFSKANLRKHIHKIKREYK